MGWQDLLEKGDEQVVLPWVGGRILCLDTRRWEIQGKLPREHGWYAFRITGRKAYLSAPSEPQQDALKWTTKGYLVGDRVIPDGVQVGPQARENGLIDLSLRVHLLDEGLDRFVRVVAGRAFEGGPLIYKNQDMPMGPEEEVLSAFLENRELDGVKNVTPALQVAFWFERWQKAEAARRREELEKLRREEEERRIKEERRQQIIKQLGDGAGRRAAAAVDFDSAAKAALAVGGAELLDAKRSVNRHEMVVRFRMDGRRFECVCDERTLRIVDSGICLTAHYDDPDFDGGTKGDTWFTLESLPSVIREAIREDKLVVYRRVT